MLALDAVHTMDAREGLGHLADESVDCILTSPPYYRSRNYSVAPGTWADGRNDALGLEPTIDLYLDHLAEVFEAAWRVLKASGTLWVNLGDCYAGPWSVGKAQEGHAGQQAAPGLVPGWNHYPLSRRSVGRGPRNVANKSLCLIPERFALRMVERGWVLRNKCVWMKPNYLPASVKDRFSCAWEYVFFFSKSRRYHFDLDAVRVPHQSPLRAATEPQRRFRASRHPGGHQLPPSKGEPRALHPLGKNPGDCWVIPTTTGFGDHPAVFPERLCERPILAGCPKGGIVLDPFAGSATTCVVAKRLGRRYLGFEVNPLFAESARRRLAMIEGGRAEPPVTGSRAARQAA